MKRRTFLKTTSLAILAPSLPIALPVEETATMTFEAAMEEFTQGIRLGWANSLRAVYSQAYQQGLPDDPS